MNSTDLLREILFSVGDYDFSFGQFLGLSFSAIVIFLLYFFIFNQVLPKYFKWDETDAAGQKRTIFNVRFFFVILALLALLLSLNFDYILYRTESATFKISTILEAILIFQVARILDSALTKVFSRNYKSRMTDGEFADNTQRDKADSQVKAGKTLQYIVYVIAFIWILRSVNFDFVIPFGSGTSSLEFRISNIFMAILILLFARLIAWFVINLILFGYYERNKINVGSRYAINQLVQYVIYVFAAIIALENLGIQMTVIWGGAAALLVGIGLGLQQVFNDLVSGLILLFERTVEVGDVVDIIGMVGTVKRIGLRTSLVETRDNKTVIVPNSKLVVDKVVNWSHYDDKSRFHLDLGVAYGTDTEKVKEILTKVATNNIYVLKYPAPFVRFKDFAASSLAFELHFWTKNFIIIEDIKSDLRFDIDKAFRENDIEIPFPQRVIRKG